MAVRMTSSGGGIRNGLNMNVEKSCQIAKPISSDAPESSARPLQALLLASFIAGGDETPRGKFHPICVGGFSTFEHLLRRQLRRSVRAGVIGQRARG
jgi:hypothetical protein